MTDVATTLKNLAALAYDQGQYAKAKTMFHRAISIFEKPGRGRLILG